MMNKHEEELLGITVKYSEALALARAKLSASEKECDGLMRDRAKQRVECDEALRKLEQVEKERDQLSTNLAEMTEDRDLWAGEHDEHECPYQASLEQARELLREAMQYAQQYMPQKRVAEAEAFLSQQPRDR